MVSNHEPFGSTCARTNLITALTDYGLNMLLKSAEVNVELVEVLKESSE